MLFNFDPTQEDIIIKQPLMYDQATISELRVLMQSEIQIYNGRNIDSRLKLEIEMFLESWRRRIDPLVPGIQFRWSFEEGHLRIDSHKTPPMYVLVIRNI